jgi:hypothetical protein
MYRLVVLGILLSNGIANAASVGDVSIPDENALPTTATCVTSGCFGDYSFANSAVQFVGQVPSLTSLPLFFQAVSVNMESGDQLALEWDDPFPELTVFQAAWGTSELAGGGFDGTINKVSLSFDSGVTWYDVESGSFEEDTVANPVLVNVSDGGSFEGAHYGAWHATVDLATLTAGAVTSTSGVWIAGDDWIDTTVIGS